MVDRDQAARILEKYGQEHILNYFDELGSEEKQELLDQIGIIDFSVLEKINREACVNLYNAAKEKNIEFSQI